jgi:hypothetical protein
MSPDLEIPRRAALRLTAWAGAGLVIGACTDSGRPPTPNGSVGPTTPEPVPLPGRPANLRVSHDAFVAHAEPCLAVNPRDPRNLLGACIAHDEAGGTHIAAYASFDAGASWRSLGGLEDSANGRDPTVTFDAAGRGYVCANTDDLHVWPTDDGGRSFGAPVLATRGHKLDHPWLAADPAPGPPSTTHLYGAWTGPDNTQLEFGRSVDGGRSFQAPRALDTVRGPKEANFASPMVAAGHGGTIHAIYGVWPPLPKALPRPEFPAPIRVISSTDRGQTWGQPVELGTGVWRSGSRPTRTGWACPRSWPIPAGTWRPPPSWSAGRAHRLPTSRCVAPVTGAGAGRHPGWSHAPATTPSTCSRSWRSTRPAGWPCRRSPTGEA